MSLEDLMIEQEAANLLYVMGEAEWKELTDEEYDKRQIERESKITLS